MIGRIVVINDLSTAKGGASLLAVESARQFAARGYRVTLLCGDRGNPALEADGIEVVALGQGRLLDGNPLTTALRGIWNHAAKAMVAGWIAANDTPDTVYHVHGWSQILSPALFAALAPVGGRVVMTAHDFFLTCPNGAMFDYRAAAPCPLTPMSGACVMRDCDRRGRAFKLWRLARQAVQERQLRASGRPPQLLIHADMAPFFNRSGLGEGDMAALPNPVVAYADHRIAAERNRDVLYVGRIEETKGVDLAAAACRMVGVRLVAAGDGAQLPALRHEYPEMEWAGRQDRAGIARLAATARMLVMPSRYMEPFGLVAVEALWSGLPVLACEHSLLAGDIVAAGAGLAIDPRDTRAFAAAIAGLRDDDRLTRAMSKSAFAHTRHLALTPDRWIDALLDAYAALLAGGPGALFAASAEWAGQSDQPSLQEPAPCASM